jgi:hypothetical protein
VSVDAMVCGVTGCMVYCVSCFGSLFVQPFRISIVYCELAVCCDPSCCDEVPMFENAVWVVFLGRLICHHCG